MALLLVVMSIVSVGLSVNAEGFTHEFDSYSKALFMMNTADGSTVYEENADEKLPMASLTKIMAYIVAYENIENIENTLVTIEPSVDDILELTGSSTAGIVAGEELTVLDLLYMLMLPSGNDVAIALAQHIDKEAGQNYWGSGANYAELAYDMGDSEFIRLMNEKAQELGCTNTNFTNPHGLHHENHYSTARDMAIISEYALKLPYFTEIVSTPQYTVEANDVYTADRVLENTNALLSQTRHDGIYYYEYAEGIKTGYHSKAGFCLASLAQKDEYSYIVVALGGPVYDENGQYMEVRGELIDTIELFEWAFNTLENKTIIPQGYSLGKIDIEHAKDVETLGIVADRDIIEFMPSDTDISEIEIIMNIPESIDAPINEGDVIGTVEYKYNGEVIGSSNAVAEMTVHRLSPFLDLETYTDIMLSPWFLICAGAVVVLVVAYFVMAIRRRR